VIRVDRLEQRARLLDGELSGLAFSDAVFDAAYRREGVEATARRWTRASKKCRSAASAWFLVPLALVMLGVVSHLHGHRNTDQAKLQTMVPISIAQRYRQ